jgi:hypothetical protein
MPSGPARSFSWAIKGSLFRAALSVSSFIILKILFPAAPLLNGCIGQ